MTDLNALFARAEAAFRAGRIEEAHGAASTVAGAVQHPTVYHLLGLIEHRRGNLPAARSALDQARALAPRHAQIANSLGVVAAEMGDTPAAFTAYVAATNIDAKWIEPRLNIALLLQQIGKLPEALDVLEHALQIAPDFARGWGALGAVARDMRDLDMAADAFERAIALEPGNARAVHGRARVALERGEADAVARYAAATALLPDEGDVAIGEAEALEGAGAPDADRRLAPMVAGRADWTEGHRVLARMRWEAGDAAGFTDAFEAALAEQPRNIAMWTTLIDTLAGADMFAEAADAAARGRAATDGTPDFALREAIHAGEAGDDARAERLFAAMPASLPNRQLHEARHRIRTGEIERAAALLDAVRAADDTSISGWALSGLVWRLQGDDRAEWLHGQEGLVAARALELDPAALAETAELLRALHRTNTHPIGQSLRGGTQTRGVIFARTEPEIRRLHAAIKQAVATHWAELPPFDPRHPLLRHREAQTRLTGSWSVRLLQSGFHVAHIHPEGVLSSASYFVLPAPTPSEDAQAGWLEIGRPPADLRLDLPPVRTIQPQVGRLALFPSSLYHGTRPFAEGERITVAFDVAV
ncbi:putative 2OG-Fe(II) oxygenase [Sphingomonas nostoxanthinifaciens]|uniref:putative 2OG-Fe(II) oxygenase n=1 Tax=Sphingomonas nostoxanthinifaciens TaxID=2872652 RepID=UPI001CC1D288|nr:putative 2OG-Fe(II) oxygenase [Sphingomonas nostoxanthinifaciens]UAK23730.1 hypothetical protein K8P63_15275 [Sphingomonas nostoxanthinifaciens]